MPGLYGPTGFTPGGEICFTAPNIEEIIDVAASAAIRIRIRSTFREFPDAKGIFAQDQFAVRRGVEIQRLLDELQFFIHRQFPTRFRIAGPPNELFTAEFFL